jgi:hypothetical protein
MREDEIYILCKSFLREEGWKIIGGQPPRGTDHYPVIEIKSDSNASKGSLGSFKPDLVAIKEGYVLLCECKPTFDPTDVAKLHEVLQSQSRINQLSLELTQRNLLHRIEGVLAVVAFGGTSTLSDDLVGVISFTNGTVFTRPALSWDRRVASLLRSE